MANLGVDVLSDAVTVMRTGRPVSARLAWRPPWGQRFATVPGAAGIQVILDGECWLIPDTGAAVHLAAGDVLLMAHGRGHALADSPATPVRPCLPGPFPPAPPPVPAPSAVVLCGAYELAPGRAHPLLDDVPDLVHLRAHHDFSPQLRAIVELLGAELERQGGAADVGVTALLDLLFLHALRAWFDRGATPPASDGGGWAAALGDPAVSAALEAIHREPARGWTVAELAAVGGLSRAPFARRFAALAGRAPLAYLTWWRMTLAARTLRDSDVPLRVVAQRVGYASEFAFAAAFKRRFGTAPGRYRREHAPPA